MMPPAEATSGPREDKRVRIVTLTVPTLSLVDALLTESSTGTAAVECPGEEEPPAWEAPASQISRRAPSPQGRG
jgi:hypothetical protein